MLWEKIYPLPCAEVFLTHQLVNKITSGMASSMWQLRDSALDRREAQSQVKICASCWWTHDSYFEWNEWKWQSSKSLLSCTGDECLWWDSTGWVQKCWVVTAAADVNVCTDWNKMETLNGGAAQTSRMKTKIDEHNWCMCWDTEVSEKNESCTDVGRNLFLRLG